MKLIIVESPNKRKTIKSFLSNDYIVEASIGHIRRLSDQYFQNTGIDVDNNFEVHYQIIETKKNTVNNLKKLAKEAEMIYLASDNDREGEAIAWHLKEVLNLKEGKYKRVIFNEITEKEVKNGLNNPRDIDMNLVNSAIARSSADKLIGFTLSPILHNYIQGKSAGRVQSPALQLLVDREKEIVNFVPKTYYISSIPIHKNDNTYKANFYYLDENNKKYKQIFDENIINNLKNTFKQGESIVSNKETVEKTISAPIPFITSSFQQECSSKLSITPKEAMAEAQRLFEGIEMNGSHTGLITYIRTDSTRMDDDFKQSLYSFISNNYGKEYIGEVKEKKIGENIQDAHECIRVVNIENTPEKINPFLELEITRQVYKLIYDRTIASAMSEYRYKEAVIDIVNNNNNFELIGKTPVFDGWKKQYVYKNNEEDKTEVKDEDSYYSTLPDFEINEKLNDDNIIITEKKTNPPKRYTEAQLIKKLEALGIGRPSTFASITEILEDPERDYTTKKKGVKGLIPTDMGIRVSDFLKAHFKDIISYSYTAEMEKELDKIANNEENRTEFISRFYTDLMKSISEQGFTFKKEYTPELVGKKCPTCGHDLIYITSKKDHKKYIKCSNKDCSYFENPNPQTKHEEVGKNCPKCGKPLIYLTSKKGTKYIHCSDFKCDYVEWLEKKQKKILKNKTK